MVVAGKITKALDYWYTCAVLRDEHSRIVDRRQEPELNFVVRDDLDKLVPANVAELERRPVAVEEELPVDEDAWRVKDRERRREADEETHRLCKRAPRGNEDTC